MIFHYFLLSLFVVSACFTASAVARKAIVGGHITRGHHFLYQVSVLTSGSGHTFECSGGILDNQFIITVASCVIGNNSTLHSQSVSILAGTYDLNVTESPAVRIEVKEIYTPKEYEPGNRDTTGDIAILKLKSPLGHLQPTNMKKLKLPKNQQETFAGKTANIAGFGWSWIHVDGDNQIGGRTDTHLRYLEANVLSDGQCQLIHPAILITKKRFCAQVKTHGHFKRGVCNGDNGSPLVYNQIVIGVLSKSPKGCDETRTSGIYTRVSHYLRFIRNAREGKGTSRMYTYTI